MSSQSIQMRRGSPADAPLVQKLLQVRDGPQGSYTQSQILKDLREDRCLVWLACCGEQAVALTSAQKRELHQRGQVKDVAYWTNLYIHPDFRDKFLYPRLPLLMLAGLKKQGIGAFYAAIRRPRVAQAHLKIGLREIAWLPVLAKPLRPLGLLAKMKKPDDRSDALSLLTGKALHVVGQVGAPVDGLFRSGLRLLGRSKSFGYRLAELDLSGQATAQFLKTIQQQDRDYLGQRWSPQLLQQRFGLTGPGLQYHLLGVWKKDQLVAGVVYRLLEHTKNIRAGVVLDVFCHNQHPRAALAALAEAERSAAVMDCQVMLLLDGCRADSRYHLKRFGYLKTAERYLLMQWPKKGPLLPDRAEDWRFSFADHDAF